MQICRGFKGQALYTRCENEWFCVVNRARTTAKAPMGFLIIHFFSIIVFIALCGNEVTYCNLFICSSNSSHSEFCTRRSGIVYGCCDHYPCLRTIVSV